MSCPRYSVKFDNLLREFSQLRGFQQTLRTVLEMVSQNRKDFKEVLQAAAWPFFVGDWRNTDEKPWLPSAHQMPPPKCPESFRAIALAQAGFFFWGAATWELRKKGPCGKLLRHIGHFYWEMLWNGMNSVSTASWNPTLRQGCHGLNLAVHKSEVRFWNRCSTNQLIDIIALFGLGYNWNLATPNLICVTLLLLLKITSICGNP